MHLENTYPVSVRKQREVYARWAVSQRRVRLLSIAVIVLSVVIAGFAWYTYPVVKNGDATAARLSGVQDGLNRQIDELAWQTYAVLESAKRQTANKVDATLNRVENDFNRLLGLESARESDQARIVGFEQELNEVRVDMARQTDALAEIRRRLDSSTADNGLGLTSLKPTDESSQNGHSIPAGDSH